MDIRDVRESALRTLLSECNGHSGDLAKRIGKSPAQVSQWLSGYRTISEDTAREIEAAARKPTGWMDEPKNAGLAATDRPVATPYLPGFEALSVPLMAASGSMGPGVDQHDDIVIGRLTLHPDWVVRTLKSLSKPDNLRFIHGYGDSMDPTFRDGDILLVDTGVPAVSVDGIYVLAANDRLYIKRVRQRLDGTFEISSDNPTVKTVDVLNGTQEVIVKGRVVWVWNGKKL